MEKALVWRATPLLNEKFTVVPRDCTGYFVEVLRQPAILKVLLPYLNIIGVLLNDRVPSLLSIRLLSKTIRGKFDFCWFIWNYMFPFVQAQGTVYNTYIAPRGIIWCNKHLEINTKEVASARGKVKRRKEKLQQVRDEIRRLEASLVFLESDRESIKKLKTELEPKKKR